MINLPIDYQFKNPALLEQALTHKSYHFEAKEPSVGHNEKLEFLGDAVLDLVLSEYLMEMHQGSDEGILSKKRASLVNEFVLSEIAKSLNLASVLRMGKGEILTGGSAKPRLLSSAYEALLGAIFLDGGFSEARRVIRSHFANVSEEKLQADFKTHFQELLQAQRKLTPTYRVNQQTGPAHEKTFEISVYAGPEMLATGWGKSKKQAEQAAAQAALSKLDGDKV